MWQRRLRALQQRSGVGSPRACAAGCARGRAAAPAALKRPSSPLLRALGGALLCAAAVAVPRPGLAFTFCDGTTMRCDVAGVPVAEYDAPPGHPLVVNNHSGLVERDGPGYRIAWNAAVLTGLPPEVHDFLFFHECAHASVPTQDELLANCVGLKTMRAAGRAGFAIETRLGAFYGRGSEYWRNTLACANAAEPAPATPAPH